MIIMTNHNHRVRCRKCGTRRTLTKHPDNYARLPRCGCGAKDYRVDKYRQSGREHGKPCNCDGYMFPHRKGSKWCKHYTGCLTDQDYIERGYQQCHIQ